MDENMYLQDILKNTARLQPNAIAIEDGFDAISYSDLDRITDQISFQLSHKVSSQHTIALYFHRSIEFIFSVFGVFKSGCSFVALDPAHPVERLKFMVDDSSALLVIASRKNEIPWDCKNIIYIEDLLKDVSNFNEGDAASSIANSSGDIAYTVYTSGSTGKPKGVMMPHGAIVNLIYSQSETSPFLKENLTTMQFTSIGFDVSIQEIMTAIFSGGKIVILPDEARGDFKEILNFISKNKIQRMFVPYAVLQALSIEFSAHKNIDMSALAVIITAGEQLIMTKELINFLNAAKCSLINQYGPSETHVATWFTSDSPYESWASFPPIGKPINNVMVYVLDENLCPVPKGEEGELHISGVCLSSGYVNNPELTKSKFITYQDHEVDRVIYKTGDIVYEAEDGNLYFKGRKDTQIKLRGNRVEVGEIEASIRLINEIDDVVVVPYKEGGSIFTGLSAFLVSNSQHHDKVNAIKIINTELGKHLPEYMLPNKYYFVASIPLTQNGKVDKEALLKISAEQDSVNYSSSTDVSRLEQIYIDVLKLNRIDKNKCFFEMGGNSLNSMRLLRNIESEFGLRINISEFHRKSTYLDVKNALLKEGLYEA